MRRKISKANKECKSAMKYVYSEENKKKINKFYRKNKKDPIGA